jgi:hypothetical protein
MLLAKINFFLPMKESILLQAYVRNKNQTLNSSKVFRNSKGISL